MPKRSLVLGAHMLEICPTIAEGKPSLEVHPLGIGGKADPAGWSLIRPPGRRAERLDDRFGQSLSTARQRSRSGCAGTAACPNCPSPARSGVPKPNLRVARAAWIYAGGAHHTGFSQSVTTEMLEDFAAIAGIELVVIDADTRLRQFKQELHWNEVYYALRNGFGV